MPRSGIAGLYSNSVFNFLSNHPTVKDPELEQEGVVYQRWVKQWFQNQIMHQNYLRALKGQCLSALLSKSIKWDSLGEELRIWNLTGFPWHSPVEWPLGSLGWGEEGSSCPCGICYTYTQRETSFVSHSVTLCLALHMW